MEEEEDIDYNFESEDSDKTNHNVKKRSAAKYLERELQTDVNDLNYNLR